MFNKKIKEDIRNIYYRLKSLEELKRKIQDKEKEDLQKKLDNMKTYKDRLKYIAECDDNIPDYYRVATITKETAKEILRDLGGVI